MIGAPVRSVHVHLDEPLAGVPATAGVGGIHLVFWNAHVPLGEWYLHPSELPLTAPQLATVASNATAAAVHARLGDHRYDRPLEELARRVAARRGTAARESAGRAAVVVVTRDRPAALARCLRHLADLDPAPAEVLVVDNSGNRTAASVTERHPGVRHLHAPSGALAAARNAGLEATSAELVAFTDDDVEVHPSWLLELLEPFADPSVASVTGLVLPAVLDTPAQLVFERHLRYLHKGFRPTAYDRGFLTSNAPRAAPVWRIGAGANLAVRRDAVTAVGGFDPRLGAGAAGCAEDSELWSRLLEAGWTCRYEPAAVVFHHHRSSARQVADQSRAYLRGHVVGLAVQYARHRRHSDLRRIVVELPGQLLKEASSDLAGGRLRRRLWWARTGGYLAGLWRSLHLLRRSAR